MKTKKNEKKSTPIPAEIKSIVEKTDVLNERLVQIILKQDKLVITKEAKRLEKLARESHARYEKIAETIERNEKNCLSQLLSVRSQEHMNHFNEFSKIIKNNIKNKTGSSDLEIIQDILSLESEIVKSGTMRQFFIHGEEEFFSELEGYLELLKTLMEFLNNNTQDYANYAKAIIFSRQALAFLGLYKIVKSFENYRYNRNTEAKRLFEGGIKIYEDIINLETLLLKITPYSKQQIELISNWGLESVSTGLLSVVQLYLMNPNYENAKLALGDDFQLFMELLFNHAESYPRKLESTHKLIIDILVILILQGKFIEAKQFYQRAAKSLTKSIDVIDQHVSLANRMHVFSLQVNQYNNQVFLFKTLAASIEGLDGYELIQARKFYQAVVKDLTRYIEALKPSYSDLGRAIRKYKPEPRQSNHEALKILGHTMNHWRGRKLFDVIHFYDYKNRFPCLDLAPIAEWYKIAANYFRLPGIDMDVMRSEHHWLSWIKPVADPLIDSAYFALIEANLTLDQVTRQCDELEELDNRQLVEMLERYPSHQRTKRLLRKTNQREDTLEFQSDAESDAESDADDDIALPKQSVEQTYYSMYHDAIDKSKHDSIDSSFKILTQAASFAKQHGYHYLASHAQYGMASLHLRVIQRLEQPVSDFESRLRHSCESMERYMQGDLKDIIHVKNIGLEIVRDYTSKIDTMVASISEAKRYLEKALDYLITHDKALKKPSDIEHSLSCMIILNDHLEALHQLIGKTAGILGLISLWYQERRNFLKSIGKYATKNDSISQMTVIIEEFLQKNYESVIKTGIETDLTVVKNRIDQHQLALKAVIEPGPRLEVIMGPEASDLLGSPVGEDNLVHHELATATSSYDGCLDLFHVSLQSFRELVKIKETFCESSIASRLTLAEFDDGLDAAYFSEIQTRYISVCRYQQSIDSCSAQADLQEFSQLWSRFFERRDQFIQRLGDSLQLDGTSLILNEHLNQLNQSILPYLQRPMPVFCPGIFQLSTNNQLVPMVDVADFANLGRFYAILERFADKPLGSFVQQYPDLDPRTILAKSSIVMVARILNSEGKCVVMAPLAQRIQSHFIEILFYLGFFGDSSVYCRDAVNTDARHMHLSWLKDHYLYRVSLADHVQVMYEKAFAMYVEAMTWKVEPDFVPALLRWIDENRGSSSLTHDEQEIIGDIVVRITRLYERVVQERSSCHYQA